MRLPTFTHEDLVTWNPPREQWDVKKLQPLDDRLRRGPMTAVSVLDLDVSSRHDDALLWVACHVLPADYVPSFKVSKLVGDLGGYDVYFHLTQYEPKRGRWLLRDDLVKYANGDESLRRHTCGCGAVDMSGPVCTCAPYHKPKPFSAIKPPPEGCAVHGHEARYPRARYPREATT